MLVICCWWGAVCVLATVADRGGTSSVKGSSTSSKSDSSKSDNSKSDNNKGDSKIRQQERWLYVLSISFLTIVSSVIPTVGSAWQNALDTGICTLPSRNKKRVPQAYPNGRGSWHTNLLQNFLLLRFRFPQTQRQSLVLHAVQLYTAACPNCGCHTQRRSFRPFLPTRLCERAPHPTTGH